VCERQYVAHKIRATGHLDLNAQINVPRNDFAVDDLEYVLQNQEYTPPTK
jgi:hypothetical protein